jgi:hypothetical protein
MHRYTPVFAVSDSPRDVLHPFTRQQPNHQPPVFTQALHQTFADTRSFSHSEKTSVVTQGLALPPA